MIGLCRGVIAALVCWLALSQLAAEANGAAPAGVDAKRIEIKVSSSEAAGRPRTAEAKWGARTRWPTEQPD